MNIALIKVMPTDVRSILKQPMGSGIFATGSKIISQVEKGYGRHHHQENLQFCRIARGSLTETLDHLNTAQDEEYLIDEQYSILREQLEETWKVLNGYISYLKRCAADGVPKSPDNEHSTTHHSGLQPASST